MKTLVAVYGSLRKGLGNHKVMEHARGKFICSGVVNGYALYPYCTAFPCVSPDLAHSVVVEVYEVDDRGLLCLNGLEGYDPDRPRSSNFYNMDDVVVVAEDVDEQQMLAAKMYVIDNYKGTPIEHGDWVKWRTGDV